VVARLAAVTRNRENPRSEPGMEDEIEFIGGKEGMDFLSSMITGLGRVVATSVSAEQSTVIETSAGNDRLINHPCSFKIIFVDKEGNKASQRNIRKTLKDLAVEVTGPSEVKVLSTFFSQFFSSVCVHHKCVFLSSFSFLFSFFSSSSLCSSRLKREGKNGRCKCRSLHHKLASINCRSP